MTDYFEEVKKIISKQFGLDEESIEEESLLETDLNISELDMEDLASELESKFQIEIPANEYSHFTKVADIVNYLYEHEYTD